MPRESKIEKVAQRGREREASIWYVFHFFLQFAQLTFYPILSFFAISRARDVISMNSFSALTTCNVPREKGKKHIEANTSARANGGKKA